MWRQLTRGLQQGFIRRLGCEKPDTNVKDGKTKAHHQNCCFTELLPCAIQKLNHCTSKKHDGSENRKEDYEKTSKDVGHHTLFEAFGWSGALIFGWAISKQLWLKQTLPHDIEENSTIGNIFYNKLSITKLLAQYVNNQPPTTFILPQLQSSKQVGPTIGVGSKLFSELDVEFESASEESKRNHKQANDKALNKPAENVESKLSSELDLEFDSAAEELKRIHEKAIGEAFNRRGIACLSNSTSSEAITYFRRASQLKYPPASFNMGQCCELGIGMRQDFQQAAEWYKVASEQGHATAMYNLGVFYAHGWGGLKADIKTAKQLFVKAASLGQPNALSALEKESKFTTDSVSKGKNTEISYNKNIDMKSPHMTSFELDIFVNNLRNGLSEDTFSKGFTPSKNWGVPLNSGVAF